jgi:hypothetical protein
MYAVGGSVLVFESSWRELCFAVAVSTMRDKFVDVENLTLS